MTGLGVLRHHALGAASEDGNAAGQQQILDHVEIAFRRGSTHLTLACDAREIEHGRVREAERLDEAAERSELTDETIGLHFFAHVQADVGLQRLRR